MFSLLQRDKKSALNREAKPAAVTQDTPAERATKVSTAGAAWGDSFGILASRSLQIIIVVVLAGAAIWGLRIISTVAIPVLLAVILACTFAPVMSWLRSKKVPDLLATVIVLFSVLLVLAGATALIVNAVSNQWDDLQKQAIGGFKQVTNWVEELGFMPSQEQLDNIQKTVVDFVTSSQFGSGALAGVSAVSTGATAFVLFVVILFFFLKDGKAIWEFLTRPFFGEAADRAERVGKATVQTFGSYVRGTATVAAVDAIGIGVGLWILQVPLALPLAVLVFVLSFIPIVGATLAGIFAALVALVANDIWSAVAVIVLVIIVNQLEGNFLQPVLMGRALKLHSLVILLALAVGTLLGGVLGAVLAVPLTAAVWSAIKVWDGDNLPAWWARPKKQPDAS